MHLAFNATSRTLMRRFWLLRFFGLDKQPEAPGLLTPHYELLLTVHLIRGRGESLTSLQISEPLLLLGVGS